MSDQWKGWEYREGPLGSPDYFIKKFKDGTCIISQKGMFHPVDKNGKVKCAYNTYDGALKVIEKLSQGPKSSTRSSRRRLP